MIPLSLLLTHFVGDFLLQSNWMALNKSKDWRALLLHVTTYSACFLWWGWRFVALTFLFHLITDAITSRITTRLWFVRGIVYRRAGLEVDYDQVKRHWFFVVIGLDQLIHYLTLAYTWGIL